MRQIINNTNITCLYKDFFNNSHLHYSSLLIFHQFTTISPTLQ
nr:MAG TPA: hypothetical protein [Caudoviricetes sp.]